MKHLIIFIVIFLPLVAVCQHYKLTRTFKGHGDKVSYVAFRSEDNLLISGADNGEIIIWDMQKGIVQQTVREHTGRITDLAFSNDGKRLVSASWDGTIKVWQLKKMKVVQTFKNPTIEAYGEVKGDEPTFAVFAPNDKHIYFGGYNLQVLKGTIKNGKVTGIYKSEADAITSGLMSPNQKQLVIGVGGNVMFIKLKNYKIVKKLTTSAVYEDAICELAFQPNSQHLAAWTVNGQLHCWNWQTQQLQYQLTATEQMGSSLMAFSEDGKLLVTGNFGNQTKLWDVTTQKVIQLLGQHTAPVVSFAFSADSKYIVTGSEDHTINLWKKPDAVIRNVANVPKLMKGRKVETQEAITVKNSHVEFRFWDNKKVDRDTISANINGAWVAKAHPLDVIPKTVKVEFTQRHNYLIIHALNEGLLPPNTIAVTVNDGQTEQLITLKSTMNTSAALKIVYDPD